MTLLKQHQDYINAGNPYTKVNLSNTEYFIILGTKIQENCKANSYVGENHLGETKIIHFKNNILSLEEGMGAVYKKDIENNNSIGMCIGIMCPMDICHDGIGRRLIGDDCCACPKEQHNCLTREV